MLDFASTMVFAFLGAVDAVDGEHEEGASMSTDAFVGH